MRGGLGLVCHGWCGGWSTANPLLAHHRTAISTAVARIGISGSPRRRRRSWRALSPSVACACACAL